MRRFRLMISYLVETSVIAMALQGEAVITTGTIERAHYAIASRPDRSWNQRVLLIAHGYRPEPAPLVADLFPDQAAFATLLEEGWLVAKTSYRRNGIIVADAITDLDLLLNHINDTFGPTNRVIVMGDSMGGMIATLIAERGGDDYSGLIAIGAALDVHEIDTNTTVVTEPKLPLLFISNSSEITGPENYVHDAAARSFKHVVPPILFRIERSGHVNVNQAERLFAIRSMNTWLDQGRSSLPTPISGKYVDATQIPLPGPSRVTLDDDHRGLTAKVTEVSAIYGNVFLNLQPKDMDAIGWTEGLWAELIVGSQTFRVLHGRDFDSVDRGEWVIFPNADGFTWLSRNWHNAAETASLRLGDNVQLRRFPSPD